MHEQKIVPVRLKGNATVSFRNFAYQTRPALRHGWISWLVETSAA